ncbi:hypothetical protein [Pontibacter ramchanderi]|nr:hypothetical protein [Pontibacter ramchanderi]
MGECLHIKSAFVNLAEALLFFSSSAKSGKFLFKEDTALYLIYTYY